MKKYKEYTVRLRNKEGETKDIGKIIFDSYKFPFEKSVLKAMWQDVIYVDEYMPIKVTLEINSTSH
jgi:hypothetical protein